MTGNLEAPRWVRVGSFRTRYFEWGVPDAPTVLLLHDGAWGGSAPVTWGRVACSLARDFRVIAPDMLGFGGSDKAVFLGESPYGFRIQHILELLRCLCVEVPVHVVGNSFGGSVALRAAAEFSGDEIRSVTSINGSGGPWRTDHALTELSHWDGTDADMARIVRLLIDEGPWFDSHVKLRAEEARNKGHYRAVKAPTVPLPEELSTPDETDDWPGGLADREFPILLVAGSRDRLLERNWTARVQAGEPACSIVKMDCKHAPNIDQPSALMDVIHPFLKQA